MKTIIIDYGSGNIESVFNALSAVKENQEIVISKNPAEIKSGNRFILPGVGAFGDCMDGLKSVNGMIEEIRKQVLTEKNLFLEFVLVCKFWRRWGMKTESVKDYAL